MSSSRQDSIASLPTQHTLRVGSINALYRVFLLTTSVTPFTTLFWDVSFSWVKANLAPYPLFLLATGFVLLYRKKVPVEFALLIALSAFYAVLALLVNSELESIFRFSMAIMPLTFYFLFDEITTRAIGTSGGYTVRLC